jgi:ElaB/YqjD/DUF883 family membrane-anchored ribosome-binding protein
MNDSLMHKVHQGQDRLARNFQAVADDAEALLRHGVEDAGDACQQARERLEKSLKHARAEFGGLEQAAVDGLSQAGRATGRYVRHNPWQAIGTAAAIGVLAGWLASRRR